MKSDRPVRTEHSLLTTRHLRLTTHHSVLTTHHSPLTTATQTFVLSEYFRKEDALLQKGTAQPGSAVRMVYSARAPDAPGPWLSGPVPRTPGPPRD